MTKTIPSVEDLAADEISHHYDDMVAPAGLTNFLGTTAVGHDLTGIYAVTFPPVSQGLASTAVLFVDGRVFESFGVPVAHTWRPDRVVRRAVLGDLSIETTTVCVPGETSVAIDVRVTNTSSASRRARFALAVNARAVNADGQWPNAESPSARNALETDDARVRLTFCDDEARAWSVQGLDRAGEVRRSAVPPTPVDEFEVGIGGAGRGGELETELLIAAGATERFGYIHAVGATREAAEGAFDRVADDVPAAVAASEAFWNGQLEAIFTPGNTEYSGHLPQLHTESDTLRRLYWWGALGVIWFRRDFAGNVLGRSYDTLMPNYWSTTTFIWDYSLSSLVHAMLDPAEMRSQLRHWIETDIHAYFGTSSLTGEGVGRWYSVNDYAMTRLVSDYLRYNRDDAFLAERIGAAGAAALPVADHVVDWAEAWTGLRSGSTLADYGEIDNLLECVSSYTHEVASLNAANVWNLRTAAEIHAHLGDHERSGRLAAAAAELLPDVVGLYVDGSGHFAAGQPDGTRIPVKHCYDFNIVGTTIADDLDESTRSEMVRFFQHDLQTPNWMRALSPWDPDASFSVRPDHQWNGAYPAWPADAARSLIALGASDVALDWLHGLVRSTNQGPAGQAHFVEEAEPAIHGGARKAPPQLPYINDWACSSSGAWVDLVLTSVFGVAVAIDGTVSADGCVAQLDPTATLSGFRVGDSSYRIDAAGKVEQE